MGMQERPHKLPADVFQAEFKMRMLINGVVPTKKSSRSDGHALLRSNFFRRNQAR